MALITRIRWRLRMLRLGWTMMPMTGADDGDEAESADSEGESEDGSQDSDFTSTGDGGEKEINWKSYARKHEREAKKARKRADEIEAKLKARADADKSEQEKALDAARQEARTQALQEAQKARRGDQLEVAVTRLAARGVDVGDGKTLRFADPEDALVFIERAVSRGDLDEDEIFTDGDKVATDAVAQALAELLRRKPRLAEGADTKLKVGDADGGKGAPGKDLGSMSVEDHLKAISRH